MKRCPHCNEQGLPWRRFMRATPAGPARCNLCGGLSYPNDAFAGVMAMVGTFAPPACLLVGLYFGSWWPVGAVVVAYGVYLVAMYSMSPKPTTEEVAKKNRWLVIGAILFVLAIVIAGVVHQ